MRLFPITRDDGNNSRSILVDPTRRFRRPVLASTKLDTAIVADRSFAGDSTAALAADFAVSESLRSAIRYAPVEIVVPANLPH